MRELTPAERIDLKADIERVARLEGFRISTSAMVNSNLSAHEQANIDMALRRYPILVELVRRLLVRPMTEEDVR